MAFKERSNVKSIGKRIRLSFILTPAIFLCVFWIMALSSSPLLESMGLTKLLLSAAFLSFCIAYFITLFIAAVRTETENRK